MTEYLSIVPMKNYRLNLTTHKNCERTKNIDIV